MKNIWTKSLCCFIGWDYNLLKECSVASRKVLHRYVGAIILLMLIWAYIGYGMATRYFEVEQSYIKIIVSIVFAFFIWMIERQIVLLVGKSQIVTWSRIGIAIVMALIGETIIDQTIFSKDIHAHMSDKIDEFAKTEFESRKREIDYSKNQTQIELDSLEIKSLQLTNDINKHPYIQTHSRKAMGIDSLGNPIYATNQEQMLNPKFQDRERIDERINALRTTIEDYDAEKQNLWKKCYDNATNNIGLLTELDVIFSKDVIFSSWTTGIFYLLVFFFFLLVELLVVSGKIGAKKCDYEILVERQQQRKISQIESILSIQ